MGMGARRAPRARAIAAGFGGARADTAGPRAPLSFRGRFGGDRVGDHGHAPAEGGDEVVHGQRRYRPAVA